MKHILLFLGSLLFAMQAFATPTALTVQELSETAYTESLSDADVVNTNSIANPNGDVFLILENPSGSGGSATVTVSVGTNAATVEVPGYGPLAKSALAVTLSDGQRKYVGPFQTRGWNNASGQLIVTTTGAVSSSVNLKAFRLKPSLRQ